MTDTRQVDATKAGAGLQRFGVQGLPVLADGVLTDPVAIAQNLWIHAKVYASGGENALHAHPKEDHAFFVLSGGATFYDQSGEAYHVGPGEGVLLPMGTQYRFESDAGQNLVALRIGGAPRVGDEGGLYPAPMAVRQHPDGSDFRGDDPANRTGAKPPVPVAGEVFEGIS